MLYITPSLPRSALRLRQCLRALQVILVGATLTACATNGQTDKQTAAASTSESVIALPLDLQTLKRPEAPSGIPLVAMTVNGQATLAIVDTGAGATLVDRELALRAGATLAEGGDGNAAGNKTVSVWRVSDLDVGLAGIPTDGLLLFASDFPEVLRTHGVGAILSPQHLVSSAGFISIDLPSSTMSYHPVAADASTTEGAVAQTCTSDDGNLVHTLALRLSGEPITLMHDTGASFSSVLASSEAGARMPSSVESSEAVPVTGAGGTYENTRSAPVRVELDDFAEDMPLLLDPEAATESCPAQGTLGMDILRHCVIRLQNSQAWTRCRSLRGETQ